MDLSNLIKQQMLNVYMDSHDVVNITDAVKATDESYDNLVSSFYAVDGTKFEKYVSYEKNLPQESESHEYEYIVCLCLAYKFPDQINKYLRSEFIVQYTEYQFDNKDSTVAQAYMAFLAETFKCELRERK